MCIIQRAGARRGDLSQTPSIAPDGNPASATLLNPRRGFTLVEIMIVVVIIGLLATIALPAFQRARERTQNTRLANDLKQFSGAFENYNLENGVWPDDETEGVLPAVMAGYIVPEKFEARTVYGGNYDWEGPGAFSFVAGVSIRNSFLEDDQATSIDEIIDDGNITTGRFRNESGAYVLVLEE